MDRNVEESKQEIISDVVDEVISLNDDNLDVEELERRLELLPPQGCWILGEF